MASLSQKPQISVRKATRADIDDVVRIYADAFGPGVMDKLMYPNGMTHEAKSKLTTSMIKTVDEAEASGRDDSKPKAKESFLIVAEIDRSEGQCSPEVIAFAWWTVWREPRPEEEWNVPDSPAAYTDEGVNAEVKGAFIGGIHDMRRRNMRGDPGICKCGASCTASRACMRCVS